MIKTPNQFAKAIQKICSHKLFAFAFNRFDPNHSTWWLVPADERPAFKFGKFFFDNRPQSLPTNGQGFYCGYNVEKGLTGQAGKLQKPMFRMNETWQWNNFYKNFEKNLQALPAGYLITVSAGYFAERQDNLSYEKYVEWKAASRPSSVSYEIQTGSKLVLRNKRLNYSDVGISGYFEMTAKKVKTLKSLLLLINNLPQLDWLWIDFYIGKMVNPSSPDFSENETYQNIFKPLEKFLFL